MSNRDPYICSYRKLSSASHPHVVLPTAAQYIFTMMPASTSTTAPSSLCFPGKLETCLSEEVCDRLATSGSSFDCADDGEREFYGDDTDTDDDSDDDEPDVSHGDIQARGLSIDRFFASDIRAFQEGGSSLSAIADEDESEDEDEEDDYGSAADDSDSTAARSLVDRIFPGGGALTRYRVALVPSLGAIEEDDESESRLRDDDDDASEGVDCPLTGPSSPGSGFDSDESSSTAFSIADSGHFDSIHLSVAFFPTLDEDEGQQRAEDDPDFGWVWIEVEDGEADEPQSVPLARSCEVREWRWHRALRRFFAL
ncbi:hypothetical protein V8D89_012737 [Ganoderma adspersum]